MAVAVKNATDARTGIGFGGLALTSVLGAVYVLAAIAIVTVGVPLLWANGVSEWLSASLGTFVDVAGLIVVIVFAIGLLAVLGTALVGPKPVPGTRAGVFTVLAGLVLIALVSIGVGRLLESTVFKTEGSHSVGLGVTLAVAVGLVILSGTYLQKPSFRKAMEAFEEQGWFTVGSYKPSQGLKVRRGTLLGILILVGSGIYTLINHRSLEAGAKDLMILLPFSNGMLLKILPDVRYTVPILLTALGLWLAYRIVNIPTFADFLIATEAEVNKVAWASKKSLIQDTIVVLATVFLFTMFLLVVDVAWGWLLSSPYVGVLKVDASKKLADDSTKKLDW